MTKAVLGSIALSWVLLLFWFGREAEGAGPLRLTSRQMQSTVGGVSVDNFLQPPDGSVLGLDNPVIRANISEVLATNSVPFEGRVNGAKIAGQTVATVPVPGTISATGSFNVPAHGFPLGTTADVEITFNDGFIPSGDIRSTNLRVNPAVDVPQVQVHVLSDSGGPAVLPQGFPLILFDTPFLQPGVPLTGVFAMDRILAQCAVSSRIQLRALPDFDIVDLWPMFDSCASPNFLDATQGPPVGPGICEGRTGEVGEFYRFLATEVLDPNAFHFFVVRDIFVDGVRRNGFTQNLLALNQGPGDNWAVIRARVDGYFLRMGRTMLHEFLHTRRLGHPNESPAEDFPIPAANNCSTGGAGQTGVNIMCPGDAGVGGGEKAGLIAAQCSTAFSRPNRAVDIN